MVKSYVVGGGGGWVTHEIILSAPMGPIAYIGRPRPIELDKKSNTRVFLKFEFWSYQEELCQKSIDLTRASPLT